MGIPDRISVLSRAIQTCLCVLVIGLALQGCGLVIDAIQLARPITRDELDAICARGRLQVGMAIEPRRPFVFPAIYTDEGLRVTGLDVELVREITAAFSQRCKRSQPVTPVLNLVRFRDLFVQLHEGKLDLFVSAISANVPTPLRGGLAYSTPYFYNGGLGGITRRPEVTDRMRAYLRQKTENPNSFAILNEALAGFAVAVQEGTSAQLYAEANLPGIKLVLCDSLPAAFESQDPAIDVILGKQPILEFIVTRIRKDWQQLFLATGKPLVLTREHYAIVTAEESYRLRWFLNDLLFRLDESGRLAEMRRRWLEQDYAYPRRAAREGLPFAAENLPQHYDQGQCRWAAAR